MSSITVLTASVTKLMTVFDLFFNTNMRLHQALYLLGIIISVYPLVHLHLNQREEVYRGSHETGWIHSVRTLLSRALSATMDEDQQMFTPINFANEWGTRVSDDLAYIYRFLGIEDLVQNGTKVDALFHTLFRPPRQILVTTRLNCKFCPVGHRNMLPSLRRRRSGGNAQVWLLDQTFQWVQADLLVAQCARCKAEYYPDRVTRPSLVRGKRIEWLEPHPSFIRISVHGVWVNQAVARAQEKALHRFHSGWANFADWINDGLAAEAPKKLTYRQSKRLFLEHFSRRLLLAHGKLSDFTLPANSSADTLAAAVREKIGKNRGILPGALEHGCMDCTHIKRYRSDNEPGVVSGRSTDVAGLEESTDELDLPPPDLLAAELPPNIHPVSVNQDAPAAEYIASENGEEITIPSLEIELPELEGVAWNKVEHTFKPKTTYCLETAQWACGWPIGWTKCYRAESPSAVLEFLNFLWDGNLDARPGFVTYDKACELLRHIVTQNATSDWLKTSKFIVDAWHYIGHRATDILCRTRCNPAPTDGSQPDLVVVDEDDNGVQHQTRAFNTETAEQLNSWLNGFESQLRQMTDINYDFYIHVLMLLYSEIVAKRIESKGRELGEGFFDIVNGDTEMDLN
ncbi:hypothetical protein MIND_00273300 [Mycena indigotica]|uniref:CxC5 like cysteine cluster associated with KDZ domain-containing protein n=1 Tax=Mycena indigotica TaxID=2126181 RepID=A0A8H6T930_9AGAR|nr:uncharacterized protein MIND_00273300 [Mycena indigotica]KAF7312592.1 hypothetical protein MIND_00273300 [Mycena indigotica]